MLLPYEYPISPLVPGNQHFVTKTMTVLQIHVNRITQYVIFYFLVSFTGCIFEMYPYWSDEIVHILFVSLYKYTTLHVSRYTMTDIQLFLFIALSNQFSQFSSVAQWCAILYDPMNRSMPGLPVHHQLLELTQTHAHRVGDAIQPSHPLSSPSPPAPNPSQHQGLFQ